MELAEDKMKVKASAHRQKLELLREHLRNFKGGSDSSKPENMTQTAMWVL
ncbi:MAG: hypothetical protein ACLRXQ_08240 [Phascolarctobacterium faecium]